MARVALQFLSAEEHRASSLVIDDAPPHAVEFILAQKNGAGRARVEHIRHLPESFRDYNFHYPGFTL